MIPHSSYMNYVSILYFFSLRLPTKPLYSPLAPCRRIIERRQERSHDRSIRGKRLPREKIPFRIEQPFLQGHLICLEAFSLPPRLIALPKNIAAAEGARFFLRLGQSRRIPDGLDYAAITSLRLEAAEKLAAIRPRSIGQASRISGVSPADISVLLVYLEKERRSHGGENDGAQRFT